MYCVGINVFDYCFLMWLLLLVLPDVECVQLKRSTLHLDRIQSTAQMKLNQTVWMANGKRKKIEKKQYMNILPELSYNIDCYLSGQHRLYYVRIRTENLTTATQFHFIWKGKRNHYLCTV